MWSVIIHGGAGPISKSLSPELKQQYMEGLCTTLNQAITMLQASTPAVDVVQKACEMLEDYPCFNAGRGATVDENGRCVLEASIMKSDLKCGAVAGLERVKNPVALARAVMDYSGHNMLISAGAEKFALAKGLVMVDNLYFVTERRLKEKAAQDSLLSSSQLGGNAMGTIGCVARDMFGNMAAGTSTGGRLNKREGRVGDTPIIGAGIYCNKISAVSGTGVGEYFIQNCSCYQVCARMEFGGETLKSATQAVIDSFPPSTGGVIAIDNQNNVSMVYNTLGMHRAVAKSDGTYSVAIWENEEIGPKTNKL